LTCLLLGRHTLGRTPEWSHGRQAAVTFREYYNLQADPYQLVNLLADGVPANDPRHRATLSGPASGQAVRRGQLPVALPKAGPVPGGDLPERLADMVRSTPWLLEALRPTRRGTSGAGTWPPGGGE
jgi:hypothetical protein